MISYVNVIYSIVCGQTCQPNVTNLQLSYSNSSKQKKNDYCKKYNVPIRVIKKIKINGRFPRVKVKNCFRSSSPHSKTSENVWGKTTF